MNEVLLEFAWLPTFERTAKTLLTETDRRSLEPVLVRACPHDPGLSEGHEGHADP